LAVAASTDALTVTVPRRVNTILAAVTERILVRAHSWAGRH
jgi:hypothetical protein